VTFNVVCVAWVFFRAPDLATAFDVLGGLGLSGPSPLVTLPLVLLVVASVAIQLLPPDWWRRAEAWLVARPVAVQGLAVGALLVASDAAVGQQGVAPFIYFQF
jgi:alginate O-acetyltransferase complex protein AlgI